MTSSRPDTGSRLLIDLDAQHLELLDAAGQRMLEAPVSTGANGPGERNGSGCTPRGRHLVRACIGAGAPLGTVFVGRRPTGEVYDAELGRRFPGRDWILTRILWLSGCEPGVNRLGAVDTMRRYIYIDGSPPGTRLGVPGSKGCVRMDNATLVELFERVRPGLRVDLLSRS